MDQYQFKSNIHSMFGYGYPIERALSDWIELARDLSTEYVNGPTNLMAMGSELDNIFAALYHVADTYGKITARQILNCPMLASEVNEAAKYLQSGGDFHLLQQKARNGMFEGGSVPSTFYEHLYEYLQNMHFDVLSEAIGHRLDCMTEQQRSSQEMAPSLYPEMW